MALSELSQKQSQMVADIVKTFFLLCGETRPSVMFIVDKVRDSVKFTGVDSSEILDAAVRHLIAEGELKREFDR